MGIEKKTPGRWYGVYRKIRFTARKGTLFSFPEIRESDRSAFKGSTPRVIFFNSLILFLLSYLLLKLLDILVTGLAATINHIPAHLYYHGVDFLIRGKDWTVDAINIVFSSSPLFMLILSGIFTIIYIRVSTETGLLRLLLLWSLFHALTGSFGEILVGAVMGKGFGFVILYMFIMDTGKLILTISAFLILFIIGLMLARQALFSANSYFNVLRSRDCRKFINVQFLWPFFAGNLVIALFMIPEINFFELMVNGTMILLIIPVIMKCPGIEDLYFDEESRSVKINRIYLLTTLLCWIAFRLVFHSGIRLGE